MSAEFENQLKTLINNTREASQHYDLYRQIINSLSKDSNREFMNRSVNFWSLTINAHLTSCRLSLCRVYDKQRKSININKFLKNHQQMLLEKASETDIVERHHMLEPVTESFFMDDLELTDERDILVSTLNKQRNYAIIHSASSEVHEESSIFERAPLTYKNYEDLLRRAENILNRYSVLYSGASYAFSTFTRDDLKNVFPDFE